MRTKMIRSRGVHQVWRRTAGRALLVCGLLAAAAVPARAQLDPLLFVKRMPPNVIIVLDTSLRMMEDVNGYYYDPNFYVVADDPAVATALNLPVGTVTYRRKYLRLQWSGTQDVSNRFVASDILAVPAVYDPANPATANAPADLAYLNPTRLGIARSGILQAIGENAGATYRWGLVKTRQNNPAWRLSPRCDKPVEITGNATLQAVKDSNPCSVGSVGRFGIYDPSVDTPNYTVTSGVGAVPVQTAANTAAAMTTLLNRGPFDGNALIPAGIGSSSFNDRPLAFQLTDAAAEAARVMGADSAAARACRNTIVVLITSGKNSGDAAYMAANDAAARASSFKSITGGGVTRRVPIYVIGLGVPAGDETELQNVAANSGGRYFAAADPQTVTRVINLAVQAGFSRSGDFATSSTSEFTGVSPIVGTVYSTGLKDITGAKVTNDEILRADNTVIPQRSNVMITAGFTLPGMDGRIRAFRVYKPVSDSTKAIKYRFDADGTRLWPDLDGRPSLAGTARTPADANLRNIYTAIPNGSGGVTVVAFNSSNAATIAPHLALPSGWDANTVISTVRGMPIGAVIGSTPALMDPPSLDPPPDVDYGRPDGSDTFAGRHKDRRSIIFVGANDGMIHAIDARTGFEVWAFIPYNLLPKLKTLLDGQPIEQFDYFVDSSPKIAEVKTHVGTSHEWRSLLIVGEGAGGTFYQTFDVTEAGMGVAPDQDDLSAVNSLLQKFDQPGESIQFLWSFPNYNSFDPAVGATINVSDSTPGGKVKIFGDLKPSATHVEKTVGFTWSDPAVGPLDINRDTNVVMVGSGYFPDIENSGLLQRGAAAPRAGRAFYLLKVEDGTLLGNPSGSACDGAGCIDVGDAPNPSIKNALQADPSAAGDNGVPIVKKAYIGDLDGKYWRFDFSPSGAITKLATADTGQPIFGSSALLFLGSVDVYMFFATGSDLLPTTSPYGTGKFKLYALKDRYPATATVVFNPELAQVSDMAGFANGERASTAPSVAGDIVFFTTSTNDGSSPCADFTSTLYAFTYLGGAAYDTDRSGRLDANESTKVRMVAGRASSPFIVDQHLYFGSAGDSGFNVEAFGDDKDFNNGVGQVGIRILSWREIR
jgi:hypothetical protein